jgi:hypothetical protein
MVLWRGRPDSGPDSAILASFRLTRGQALGRRLRLRWLLGALAVPLLVFLIGPRAVRGLLGQREAGVDVDDRGVRPVPGAWPPIPWADVVDVYAERHGRRTVAALRLDSGAVVRLPAPYDGCLLGHDPEFEDKLFTLRNLWETHRHWHTP